MRQTLLALVAIGLVASLAGAGTMAFFNDTETSGGNTFTTGTLDLKVGGKDNPDVVHIELSDIAPGWSQGFTYTLKNTGTLPGKLSVEISAITNKENGQNEPEALIDPTAGEFEGELGDKIIVGKVKMGGVRPRMKSPDGYKCPWTKNLNYFDGRTLYAPAGNAAGILESGEEETFSVNLRLDSDVGNCVQSDSVEFDITFHLDQ